MAEFVEISKLDTYIADAIKRVNDGVALARKSGVMSELPPKIDFDVVVIADGGWQALASIISDDSNITEKAGGGRTTVVTEAGNTVEVQSGYSTDAESGSTTDSQRGEDVRKTHSFEEHTNNGDKVTTEEE